MTRTAGRLANRGRGGQANASCAALRQPVDNHMDAAAAPPQGGKMKRWMFFAAPVTVALILGLVVYALPASGSSTSLLSRIAKLEAQTKALKASNTKLTKQVKSLNGF